MYIYAYISHAGTTPVCFTAWILVTGASRATVYRIKKAFEGKQNTYETVSVKEQLHVRDRAVCMLRRPFVFNVNLNVEMSHDRARHRHQNIHNYISTY